MKFICLLLSTLSLVNSAPVVDLATCVNDAIQLAGSAAEVNLPEDISRVNSKCQTSDDLLKCHQDVWEEILGEHTKQLAYTDSVQNKLDNCILNNDLSLLCLTNSIHDPQSWLDNIEADKMRQTIAAIRRKCDIDSKPSSCADLAFEVIREANHDHIYFYEETIKNLNVNC